MRRSVTDGVKTVPFEEEEFIIRQTNTFGRTRPVAKQLWDEHAAGNAQRDYDGHGSTLRLWLPEKEFKLQQKETFMEGAACEGSDVCKNPTAHDRDGFRRLVHDRSLNLGLGHEFLSGRSTLAERELAEAQKRPNSACSAASSTCSTTTGPSSIASDMGRDDAPETIEDEPPAKKPRKAGGNLANLTAKMYETGNGKLNSLTESVRRLVSMADDVVKASQNATVSADRKAGAKTRGIYMRQVHVHRSVARQWLGEVAPESAVKVKQELPETDPALQDDEKVKQEGLASAVEPVTGVTRKDLSEALGMDEQEDAEMADVGKTQIAGGTQESEKETLAPECNGSETQDAEGTQGKAAAGGDTGDSAHEAAAACSPTATTRPGMTPVTSPTPKAEVDSLKEFLQSFPEYELNMSLKQHFRSMHFMERFIDQIVESQDTDDFQKRKVSTDNRTDS